MKKEPHACWYRCFKFNENKTPLSENPSSELERGDNQLERRFRVSWIKRTCFQGSPLLNKVSWMRSTWLRRREPRRAVDVASGTSTVCTPCKSEAVFFKEMIIRLIIIGISLWGSNSSALIGVLCEQGKVSHAKPALQKSKIDNEVNKSSSAKNSRIEWVRDLHRWKGSKH